MPRVVQAMRFETGAHAAIKPHRPTLNPLSPQTGLAKALPLTFGKPFSRCGARAHDQLALGPKARPAEGEGEADDNSER